ncbi:Stf0 family sulfotransferase [Paenibacillus pinihumi]|uniref:Stf0 family sulfotransferase n=1 Tax=Paenibacillus pinihumi TaxID=669462 RepID=UPI000424A108|nr:Stf0 family sulfotransferase [Paenibacillus pinihumi]
MRPKQSYTIWFSQRTGSTLLCEALKSTGVAGNIGELLHGVDPHAINKDTMEHVWKAGTTPNGVFGIKLNYDQSLVDAFRKLYALPDTAPTAEVWSAAFPGSTKHIFMTRRNKVRLAVSWWRAIVSGEWHRQHGAKPQEHELADQYKFEAIRHLVEECMLREVAIEDFMTANGIVPMTIVYEDFIQDYEGTVLKVLDFLEVKPDNVTIASPAFDRLADDTSEQWVQRYRREVQQSYERKAW